MNLKGVNSAVGKMGAAIKKAAPIIAKPVVKASVTPVVKVVKPPVPIASVNVRQIQSASIAKPVVKASVASVVAKKPNVTVPKIMTSVSKSIVSNPVVKKNDMSFGSFVKSSVKSAVSKTKDVVKGTVKTVSSPKTLLKETKKTVKQFGDAAVNSNPVTKAIQLKVQGKDVTLKAAMKGNLVTAVGTALGSGKLKTFGQKNAKAITLATTGVVASNLIGANAGLSVALKKQSGQSLALGGVKGAMMNATTYVGNAVATPVSAVKTAISSGSIKNVPKAISAVIGTAAAGVGVVTSVKNLSDKLKGKADSLLKSEPVQESGNSSFLLIAGAIVVLFFILKK